MDLYGKCGLNAQAVASAQLTRRTQHLQALQVKQMAHVRPTYHTYRNADLHIRTFVIGRVGGEKIGPTGVRTRDLPISSKGVSTTTLPDQ